MCPDSMLSGFRAPESRPDNAQVRKKNEPSVSRRRTKTDAFRGDAGPALRALSSPTAERTAESAHIRRCWPSNFLELRSVFTPGSSAYYAVEICKVREKNQIRKMFSPPKMSIINIGLNFKFVGRYSRRRLRAPDRAAGGGETSPSIVEDCAEIRISPLRTISRVPSARRLSLSR